MKRIFIMALSLMGISTVVTAQSWQTDTINMGESYGNNVYYSLNNGVVETTPNNNWDLGFRTELMSSSVLVNHAGKGIKVFPLPNLSAAADFGTDLTNDTLGFTFDSLALYNSLRTWDTGALSQDRDPSNVFDLGWGVYEPASHLIMGDKIYLLKTPTHSYQLWIEYLDPFNDANPPLWKFHIARLDGTNKHVIEHHSKPDYENKLLAYYDIEANQFINQDPDNNAWDLIFTRYTEQVTQGPTTMMYPVTGVLSNKNRASMSLRGNDAVDANWHPSYSSQMNTLINNVGRDWKKQTQTNNVYDLDTVSYFMKDVDTKIWQFEFVYATTGTAPAGITPGQIVLRKRMVENASSIHGVDAGIQQLTIVPNPAKDLAYFVIDSKDFAGAASISIIDLTGNELQQKSITLNKGLQQIPLNTNNFAAGLYLVNLKIHGQNLSIKMIIK